MGCYDVVRINCPSCKQEYDAQSKGGDCKLATYTLENVPEDVYSNINRHAPFICQKCGTLFEVRQHKTVPLPC